jgi:hypothetical protein
VSVTLYTSAGSLVASTATDASGHYTFSSVAPGEYLVNFAAPAGYVFSPMGQGGNSTLDSDANSSGTTEPFSLAVGQTKTDVDAGLEASGSIGDFVWADQNQNGVQDAGELGLVQIEVGLYASDGSAVASTLTDGTGHYQFDDLNPGTYYVAFLAPPDYVFSPKGQGTDSTRDSDANTATGQTDPFTLTAGQMKTDIDAGLYSTGSSGGTVGDFVWNDTNKDGIQDAGEPGISGVSVSLYTYSGSLVSTTTTDGTGHYLFSQVALGSYYVTFTAPPNYLFSPSWQGTDPTVDSDPNAMGQTDIFDVSPYDQTRTDIDAGLYSSSGSGSGHGGAATAFVAGSGSGSGSGVGGAMPDTGTAWGQIPGGWVSGSGSGSGSGLARRSAPTVPPADSVLAAVSALLATPPESQASMIIAQPPSLDLAPVTDRLPSEPDHTVSVDRAGAGALPGGNDPWVSDNLLGALPDPVFARNADALADALAGSWAEVRPDDLER